MAMVTGSEEREKVWYGFGSPPRDPEDDLTNFVANWASYELSPSARPGPLLAGAFDLGAHASTSSSQPSLLPHQTAFEVDQGFAFEVDRDVRSRPRSKYFAEEEEEVFSSFGYGHHHEAHQPQGAGAASRFGAFDQGFFDDEPFEDCEDQTDPPTFFAEFRSSDRIVTRGKGKGKKRGEDVPSFELFFERDMLQLLHESRSTYRKAKERAFLLAVERDMVISLKVHRMLGFRVFGKWPRYLRMLCHRLCQYHGFDCVAEKPADPNDQTFYRELGLQVFKKPGVSRCREPSICRMALHVCGSKCMNGQTGGSASFGSLWGDPLWDPAYQKREKIPGVTQPTYVDRLIGGWKGKGKGADRREKSPAEEAPREQEGGPSPTTTHQSVGPETSSSSCSPSEKQRTRATTTEVLEEDLKLLDEQDGLQPRDEFSRPKGYNNHAGGPRGGRGQLYHQEKGSSSCSTSSGSGSAPITAQQKGWRRITSGTTNWETRGAAKGGKVAEKDDAKAGKGSAAAPGAGGGAGAGGASSRGKGGKMNIIGKRQENSEAEPPQSAESSAAEKPSTGGGQRQQPHPQESSAGTTESKTTKSSSKTGGGGSGEGGAGEEGASSDSGEKEEKNKRRAHEKRLLLEQKAKLARLVGIDSQNDPSKSTSERSTKSGQHRGWDLLQQLVGLVSCGKRRQE